MRSHNLFRDVGECIRAGAHRGRSTNVRAIRDLSSSIAAFLMPSSKDSSATLLAARSQASALGRGRLAAGAAVAVASSGNAGVVGFMGIVR